MRIGLMCMSVSVVQSKVPEHTCLIMDKVGQVRKIETVYHQED